MVDKALVHFAISRLDRRTEVVHILPAGFCQDDVVMKVSYLWTGMQMKAGNASSSVVSLDHAVDGKSCSRWKEGGRGGVRLRGRGVDPCVIQYRVCYSIRVGYTQ